MRSLYQRCRLLPSLAQHLLQEKEQNCLSCANLFVGEPYTGKRALSLYLAGLYLVKESALDSPLFKTIGRLPRLEEWQCLSQLYEENNLGYEVIQSFLAYFLRKFSPPLWEASENKNRALFPMLVPLQEALMFPVQTTSKEWKSIKNNITKIIGLYPKSISIEQIRSLKEWAYTLKGKEKFVLIEEGHSLSTAAANALLKLLEEPPEHFMCVLTTHNKQLLPPTLLSRLRCYQLVAYSKQQYEEIIRQYDSYPNEYENLRAFFLSFTNDESHFKIKDIAKDYYFALQERENFPTDLSWEKVFENKENNERTLKLFLGEFLSLLQKSLYENPQEKTHLLSILNSLVTRKLDEALRINQNPYNFLENLYYELRNAWNFEES